MNLSNKIIRLVIRGHRRHFAVVMVVAFIGAFVELVGVTTIFPFLALLSRPELARTQPLLNFFYEYGGFADERAFILAVGFVAIAGLIGANIYVFAKSALMVRFASIQMGHLASRLLRHYINKSYLYFVENNSAKIAKDVLSQSDTVANIVLLSWMTVISESITLATLVMLIIWVNPAAGLTIVLGLGTIVGGTYFAIRRKIFTLGQMSDDANGRRFKHCLETLGAVKEIKATETESFFSSRFQSHANELASAFARVNILQTLPSYLVPSVAGTFIIGLGITEVWRNRELSDVVQILTIYVIAGYRLLPSLMKFSGAASQLRQQRTIFDNVVAILEEPLDDRHPAGDDAADSMHGPLRFENVVFRYPSQAQPVFDGLNLTIAPSEFVALVGSSGAGKSTLVDLLLGLLSPDGGKISIGSVPLGKDVLAQWHRKVAYVPQSIFLLDGTIAENISFGVPPAQVDQARVHRAADMARLSGFIGSLPDGYDSMVGERGSRLSGGQRQRLGIARAIYRQPEVLVLDESTSALDGITESEIVAALEALKGRLTVIVIAHRRSSVQICDRVVLLDQGRVVDDGGYQELLVRNARFSRLMSDFKPSNAYSAESKDDAVVPH